MVREELSHQNSGLVIDVSKDVDCLFSLDLQKMGYFAVTEHLQFSD